MDILFVFLLDGRLKLQYFDTGCADPSCLEAIVTLDTRRGQQSIFKRQVEDVPGGFSGAHARVRTLETTPTSLFPRQALRQVVGLEDDIVDLPVISAHFMAMA